MKLSFCALFTSFLFSAFGQNATVQDPLIIAPQYRVYISDTGDDTAMGDSLNPLLTFGAALDKLIALSGTISGNVYGEVVVYAGSYSEVFRQPLNKYQVGSKLMNVGLRGKGLVILDGTAQTVNPGGGMVYLLGSNILVRNLVINYSTDNGVRFGYNFNGTVINSHDIWIDSVEVSQTLGHGILVGIGALNANGSSSLIPRAERFKISNCHVHDAVNYNTPQSQWGSALKFWNASHCIAHSNLVHDNSGEGIDFDYCDTILVDRNHLHDNYANIYLDKVEYAVISNNLIYNTSKKVSAILMGIEAFTAYITDHYIKDVYVFNNIILNTTGINIWQGIYSAIQNGYFSNIQIHYNTIIGKQQANGAQISYSYETFLGQPVPNVIFSDHAISGNIITAHPDSLNNNRLMSSPLDPHPGLLAAYNKFNMNPGFGYNGVTDLIEPNLPVELSAVQLNELRPNSVLNPEFIFSVPVLGYPTYDYFGIVRNSPQTNAGAAELVEDLGLAEQHSIGELLLFPNPANDDVYTSVELEGKMYRLLAVNGSLIRSGVVGVNGFIELNGAEPGLYLMRVDGHTVCRLVIR